MITVVLGLITIALILVVLFQIAKVGEVAMALKQEQTSADSASTNKLHGILFLIFLVLFFVGGLWSTLHYQHLFLPPASSEHGKWIENMFFWTWAATIPVFVVTHIALFWFSFKYSDDGSRKAYQFPGSNKIEMIWTVIPAVVMVLLVVEGMRNWYKITGPAPENAIVVEANAQQFSWTMRYAGPDNKLGKKTVKLIGDGNALGQDWSDANGHDDFISNDLHLPVGKPVLVKISAIDVLHSFYLPHFKVKMDAVPGIPTQFWFVPTKTTAQMQEELGNPEFKYELACAELCGAGHSNMRREVIIETEAEYNKWFAEQKAAYLDVKDKVEGQAAPAQAHTPEQNAKSESGTAKPAEGGAQQEAGHSGGH